MKERIAQLLAAKNLTASKFAEALGVQASGISHILSGRNKPGYDLIVRILTVFSDISPDWLLLGTGSMFRDADEATVIGTEEAQRTLYSRDHTTKDMQLDNRQPLLDFEPDIVNFTENSSTEPEIPLTLQSQVSVDKQEPIDQCPDASIEQVMIFYSDNTFKTYNVRK